MQNAWLPSGGASALRPAPFTSGEAPPHPPLPPDPPDPSVFPLSHYPPLSPASQKAKKSSSTASRVKPGLSSSSPTAIAVALRPTTAFSAGPIYSSKFWKF
ncbi:hypothetical protein Bca52824_017626 [Brassica carinata]|uniref:Uncharacterized protein n=1 Tax=Brassica carinata TaxID=52824 RepID=A0A8X7VMX9_BRACI|nr:hypothetical protein Bca52824_017626 [Brassica carinata]